MVSSAHWRALHVSACRSDKKAVLATTSVQLLKHCAICQTLTGIHMACRPCLLWWIVHWGDFCMPKICKRKQFLLCNLTLKALGIWWTLYAWRIFACQMHAEGNDKWKESCSCYLSATLEALCICGTHTLLGHVVTNLMLNSIHRENSCMVKGYRRNQAKKTVLHVQPHCRNLTQHQANFQALNKLDISMACSPCCFKTCYSIRPCLSCWTEFPRSIFACRTHTGWH